MASRNKALGEFLEKIATSVTLGYQESEWGIERIALDGIQNHLPADSRGSKVSIDFETDDGLWLPFSERKTFRWGRPRSIRFSDDGKGYSYKLLQFFHSTKKGNVQAVGQFGEGIKMLSAAAVREGMDIELRSRDWVAVPSIAESEIDGENIKRLDFDVYRIKKFCT